MISYIDFHGVALEGLRWWLRPKKQRETAKKQRAIPLFFVRGADYKSRISGKRDVDSCYFSGKQRKQQKAVAGA